MPKEYPGNSLQRLQQTATDILAIIDNICRKNDIEYIIVAGTCLGAVRHGGFIPWDDDIDVAMPYDQWLRFMEIAPKELPQGYSLHHPLNTPGFSGLWAKVYKDNTRYIASTIAQAGCEQGIFVDVFPYINLNADPKRAKEQRNKAIMCQRKLYLHYIAHPLIPKGTPFPGLADKACAVLHHTIAKSWTPEKLIEEIKPYLRPETPGDEWINLGSAQVATFKDWWLWPAKEMKFGHLKVMGPANPDPYLRADYGDYMQFPPEEERFCDCPTILDFGDGVNVMEEE